MGKIVKVAGIVTFELKPGTIPRTGFKDIFDILERIAKHDITGLFKVFRFPIMFKILEPVERSTPLQRTGDVDEIADVVHFLCSDASRFVTGQNIVIDGGLSLPQAGIDETLKWSLDMMAKAKAKRS